MACLSPQLEEVCVVAVFFPACVCVCVWVCVCVCVCACARMRMLCTSTGSLSHIRNGDSIVDKELFNSKNCHPLSIYYTQVPS